METVLTLPGRPITNAVEEAVFLVFGGLQAAAAALSVGTPTIHAALKEGCVRTKVNAEKWEHATTAAGCTVPREELIGWAKWRGPKRHPDPEKGRKGPSGSSTPELAAVPTGAGSGAPAGAEARQTPAATLRRKLRRRGRACSTRKPLRRTGTDG